ncbi:MAG: sensor histidine kinase KdpD [candidate division NC10 bacterium]|nr:sensor histidine kinase KdpD [candidate division NC10 bacterium]
MSEHRPDPDALLVHVQAEETRRARGKLKIFLGAAAGVGKTYAMLQAAHERRSEGLDVAVGWAETHGRAETEALLQGLEILSPRRVEYRGTALKEFDLDGALARRPAILLVDELAHTNAPSVRHPKRWQDVTEILNSGIDVYTTLNIQHIESLTDVVAKITGVVVRETVPDAILDEADEVALVDLPPDELLERLKDGKVYVPENAQEAIRNFFRKGNLIALRELALRRTADRVDISMRGYMRDHAIGTTWPVAERLLISISSSPQSPRVVRAAKRMATALRAEWIVAYVETPGQVRLSPEDRSRLADTLRLAEQLGAETVTLTGQSISEELLAFARTRNVTKIVIGKPLRPLWRRLLFGSIADALIRGSGEIDIHVISGEGYPRPVPRARLRERGADWAGYGLASLVFGLCTGLAWLMFPYFELSNLIMAYLLGVVVVATRIGLGPSILASILSVAAFDFFFVPPYYTFSVSDTQYFVTFGVMERRTAALYAMSRELAGSRGVRTVLETAVRHLADVFRCQAVVLLPDATRQLTQQIGLSAQFDRDTTDLGASQWVYEHGQMAGPGTGTLPGATALFLPLTASRGTLGVLGIRPAEPHALEAPEQLHLLEAFANQAALAFERAQLAEEAQQAHVKAETEQLRSSLLSSVSHDLRTPLASITGTLSSVLEDEDQLDRTTRRGLLQSVYDEVERLNRLVNNLLDMMRLESGPVTVKKEWHLLEEVVGTALGHMEKRLQGRPVAVELPADPPLVQLDAVMIEQVLVNLIENAVKYTPPGSPIEISAARQNGIVRVEVADRGPGVAAGDEQRVFEKFYRGHDATIRGVGLGLAICRAILEAHGGKIWAWNRPEGGAVFRFTLPATERPPEVPEDV